jgi:hypothetical protein
MTGDLESQALRINDRHYTPPVISGTSDYLDARFPAVQQDKPTITLGLGDNAAFHVTNEFIARLGNSFLRSLTGQRAVGRNIERRFPVEL